MACSVDITNVKARDVSDGIARSIFVEGTAPECSVIRVELTSCERPTVVEDIHVGPDGTWSREITGVNCPCGVIVEVKASCIQSPDPNCEEDHWSETLECDEEPTPRCPEVSDITLDIAESCTDDLRRVTISATITNTGTDPVFAQWEFDTDVYGESIIVDPGETVTVSQDHNYPSPGSYTATLHIEYPRGCASTEQEIVLEDPCVPQCPGPEDITVMPGECNPDGTRDVIFSFPSEITAHLDFGDGRPDARFTGRSQTHPYPPPGPYTAVLTAEGCAPVRIPVPVLDPCPVTPVTGACCLPDGTCAELSEADCRARRGTYMGDGTSCADVDCSNPPPPPDGHEFCGSCLCCILCAIWSLLLAGYIVGLATCFLLDPVWGAISTGGILAFTGFYIGLCGPCAWARCTIVGVVIGVIAAIIVLIISWGFTAACLWAAGGAAVGFLVGAIAILTTDDC